MTPCVFFVKAKRVKERCPKEPKKMHKIKAESKNKQRKKKSKCSPIVARGTQGNTDQGGVEPPQSAVKAASSAKATPHPRGNWSSAYIFPSCGNVLKRDLGACKSPTLTIARLRAAACIVRAPSWRSYPRQLQAGAATPVFLGWVKQNTLRSDWHAWFRK